MAKEVENEKIVQTLHTDIPGMLCHLVLQQTACGDTAFATASQVAGHRLQTTSRLRSGLVLGMMVFP
jgi:hypothetical protein